MALLICSKPRTRCLPETTPLPPGLLAFFDAVESIQEPLDCSNAGPLLRDIDLSPEEAHPLCQFDDVYVRTVIRRNDRYEAILIAWRPGQFSPIHDHGVSECGARIIAGTATETLYRPGVGDPGAPGYWKEGPTFRYFVGNVMLAEHGAFHRMGCDETAPEPLITLHLYSPPLLPAGVLGPAA